jgi:cysteine synthase A
MIYSSILQTIGHTPIVYVETIGGNAIYLKLEMFNPGLSVKDRVAYEMIENLKAQGLLGQGQKAVEGTSGNTGIGLSLVCAYEGIPLTIVMPENMSKERQDLMKAYGSTLVLTPKAEGMAGAEKKAAALAQEGYVFLNQFENPDNYKAHEKTTGPEIIADFPDGLDYFVAGVGTAGTLMGTGRALKKRYKAIRLVAVEPKESPILEGGAAGPHSIQGIGANFVPPLYDKSLVDEIIPIESEKAIARVKELAHHGLFLGISSGASLLACEEIASKEGPKGLKILGLAPDGGIKYMSMDIYGK